MKIAINNKEFDLVFDYTFVQYVIRNKKLKGFPGYAKYLQVLACEEDDFGPDQLELISEIVVLAIESIGKKQPKITVKEVAGFFWQQMDKMIEVIQFFMESQPQLNKDVVDPSQRLGK